jgi:hypothetical protein
MILSLLIAVGVFAGGVLLSLLGWVLRASSNRKRRRTLASALVGEIAGILRIIETNELEFHLREGSEKRQTKIARSTPPMCPIPRSAIFEANACELGLFRPELSRKLSQFHTLLAGVSANTALLPRDPDRAKATLVQLQEALLLADDILRNLKPLL